MKIAASEGLYNTEAPASFSLFEIGSLDGKKSVFNITVPHLLSVLGTNSWNGRVEGMNNLQAQYRQKYGPRNYLPNVAVSYCSFRIMLGIVMLLGLLSLLVLWLWPR